MSQIKENNLCIPKSIRSETKAKFDALLKSALSSKTSQRSPEVHKSTQKLISEDEDTDSNENFETNEPSAVRVDVHAPSENPKPKNFILNKFLSEHIDAEDDEIISVEIQKVEEEIPSVKQRKRWTKPTEITVGAFNEKHKIVNQKEDSTGSSRTYTLPNKLQGEKNGDIIQPYEEYAENETRTLSELSPTNSLLSSLTNQKSKKSFDEHFKNKSSSASESIYSDIHNLFISESKTARTDGQKNRKERLSKSSTSHKTYSKNSSYQNKENSKIFSSESEGVSHKTDSKHSMDNNKENSKIPNGKSDEVTLQYVETDIEVNSNKSTLKHTKRTKQSDKHRSKHKQTHYENYNEKNNFDIDTDVTEKSDSGNEKQIKKYSSCSPYEEIEMKELSKTTKKHENVKRKSHKQIRRRSKDSAHKDKAGEPLYSYDKIVKIIIHKTDRLKLDSMVVHPVVKIHVVNETTGEYLQKSDINRPVVYYYENKNITYMEPIMTQTYNLQKNRSLFPCWEESVVLNEDFDYFLSKNNSVILFFEIMDFVTNADYEIYLNRKDVSKGWYKIAWAFLKLRGKHDAINVFKEVRLQLFYPGRMKHTAAPKCDIYDLWCSKKLKKYPATLYVTVKSFVPPRTTTVTFRSQNALEPEKTGNIDDLNNEEEEKSYKEALEINLNKLLKSYCDLPNKLLREVYSYDEGCLAMKFSNNGSYLACGVLQGSMYFIAVFSVATFEEMYRFPGHEGLIYDICWTENDDYILSASADCTVCIWDLQNGSFVQMLPHPFYVYCCISISSDIIATGGYDQIVRLWKKKDEEQEYSLYQELENHKGYITSLCARKENGTFYSSDSAGKIVEWLMDEEKKWIFGRELLLAELVGVIINQILINKKETKMLVHARNSILRLIDLRTLCILHWFKGALNERVQTFCSFCSCNNFVLCGSENGFIHVWDTEDGHSVGTYFPYNLSPHKEFEVHNVQFHPKEPILAIAHYGDELPILLCKYGKEYKGFDLGLKLAIRENKLHCAGDNLSLKRRKSDVNTTVRRSSKTVISFQQILKKIDEIIYENK